MALAPSQVRVQPPPQLSMSQVPPAGHVVMLHPPLTQVPSLQVVWLPVHSMVQAPLQLAMVQVAPLQGIEQAPAFRQSMVQVAPGRHLVSQ